MSSGTCERGRAQAGIAMKPRSESRASRLCRARGPGRRVRLFRTTCLIRGETPGSNRTLGGKATGRIVRTFSAAPARLKSPYWRSLPTTSCAEAAAASRERDCVNVPKLGTSSHRARESRCVVR